MLESEDKSLRKNISIDAKHFTLRFREALTKPVTLVIAAIVFFLTVGAEYVFSRVMDAFWEVEPPEEIQLLNSELHSASDELKKASVELESLVEHIDKTKIEDPELRKQLFQLDEKLLSLNTLVIKTFNQTEKVATISETLRQDWIRNKRTTNDEVDGVPDVTLSVGEGVQLCNGLTALGVYQIGPNWVRIALNTKKKLMKPGERHNIVDESWIDFIGTKNNKGLFKIHCNN